MPRGLTRLRRALGARAYRHVLGACFHCWQNDGRASGSCHPWRRDGPFMRMSVCGVDDFTMWNHVRVLEQYVISCLLTESISRPADNFSYWLEREGTNTRSQATVCLVSCNLLCGTALKTIVSQPNVHRTTTPLMRRELFNSSPWAMAVFPISSYRHNWYVDLVILSFFHSGLHWHLPAPPLEHRLLLLLASEPLYFFF